MRTFFIVWLGQFISQTGGRLSGFALGVWVFQRTGSATLFALIATFALLPGVLVGPIAGLVADKVDRRLVMIVSDSGAALCTLAVAILLALGRLELWQIYLTQGLAAAFSAFQAPAFAAAITQLVPREELGRAAGLNQLADGLSLVLAAPLAGLLLGSIGLAGIVAIDLITFAFAVITLFVVRFPPLPASAEPAASTGAGGWGPLLHDASAGLRYNLARPGLLGINLAATQNLSHSRIALRGGNVVAKDLLEGGHLRLAAGGEVFLVLDVQLVSRGTDLGIQGSRVGRLHLGIGRGARPIVIVGDDHAFHLEPGVVQKLTRKGGAHVRGNATFKDDPTGVQTHRFQQSYCRHFALLAVAHENGDQIRSSDPRLQLIAHGAYTSSGSPMFS